MNFWGDDRGAAIQIGAVILFAFVVIAMASYQATVVPSQNSGVEFNHNQDVQSQMVDLTTGLDASARDGTRGSHAVRLGTTYPSRTFFVNPGPPSGQLRTVESGNITFSGITVSGDEPDNVETFWNATDPIPTTHLQYEPNYHAYRSAPTTVYEHGELINDNPRGSPTTLASGDLIDDGELSLLTLRGEVQSASSSTVTVPRRSLSSSGNTVTVTSGTITLPIRSDADRYQTYWEDRLSGQDGITTVQTNGATVEFDIDGELDLRMAEIGVGSVSQGTSNDRAAYLYQVDTATVEVRDRFNNPVEGATVAVEGESDDRTSGDDGRVSVGADRVGDEIDWSIDGSTDDEKTLTTTVDGDDVGSGSAGSSSSSAYDVNWLDCSESKQSDEVCNAEGEYEMFPGDSGEFWMEATDDAGAVRVSGAPVDFYVKDQAGIVDDHNPKSNQTGSDGYSSTVVDVASDASGGERFILGTSSGGDFGEIRVIIAEPLEFAYAETPSRGDQNTDIEFTIRNNGGESVTIDRFEVRDADGETPFGEYEIDKPTGGTLTGTGSFDAGQIVSHDGYSIGETETAAYRMSGFQSNMNMKNFEFVVYTDDGREFVFSPVNVSN
jgi:hypothetical protein